MNAERQQQLVRGAAARAGLTARELWVHYFSIGGSAAEFEIDAYLHGMTALPPQDRDVLAHAVNELLTERRIGLPVPFVDVSPPGTGDGSADFPGSAGEPALMPLGAVGAFLLTSGEAEVQRLASLQRTGLLDTPAEERFDRITLEARELFGVATSAVSFLAGDRQYLKSVAGHLPANLPRDVTFCDHTIRGAAALIVGDAMEDDRFKTSPLVREDPRFRFYAGRPLRGPGGWNIGTFCILDQQPRTFNTEQESILEALTERAQQEIPTLV